MQEHAGTAPAPSSANAAGAPEIQRSGPASLPDRPRRDAYDVVVIGSGLGGLSAAALLARAGLRTLIVERQDGVGGYARAYKRGPYTFDPAVHWTPQGGPGQLFDLVLRHIGTRDRFTMLAVDVAYEVDFPGYRAQFPVGVEAFIAAHQRDFPHEAAGIARFFQLCAQVQFEMHQISMTLSMAELDKAAAQYPTLFRCLRATYGEILDECVTDPRAKAVCGASWPYMGLPPDTISFIIVAQTLINQLEGTWYCQGSFQNLADALAAGVELNGGEVVVGNGARRILLEEGKTAGVELDNGEVVRATTVISNADARQTFDRLVGEEHLPAAFVRRLRRMTFADSAVVVCAATNLPVQQWTTAHETFLYPDWDHATARRELAAARPAGAWINVPTMTDPSLAPPGEHIVIVSSMAKYDIGRPWEQHKGPFAEMLLTMAERVIPGLRANLTHLEVATPLTLERFSSNTQGAMYGWANVPMQAGTKRMGHQSPIPGLYLSGHWSMPGTGTIRVFASGVHTAQMVMHNLGLGSALPTFADADLPAVG